MWLGGWAHASSNVDLLGTPFSFSMLPAQVWQFTLQNVNFRVSQGSGSTGSGSVDIRCDKAKVICVDCKLLEPSTAK
jgi:hypothetical protein